MRVLVALLIFAASARADDCHSAVMIVLDRSCSMNQPPQPGGTQTKWELAGLALQTATTKYNGKLDFGLIMFPDQTGMDCLQDGPIYVNVGPGHESDVVTKVMSTMPTGPCVTDIKPAFDQVSKDPAYATKFAGGARHFVLFISDGEQTCGGGNNQIAASIKALYDNGYPTYIVGFGGDVSPAALDQFATAGGLARPSPSPDMGGHLYYQADDGASLTAALDQIIGGSVGEFSCPGAPCPDGRCFEAGLVCAGGFCQPSPPPNTTTGTNGGSGGDGGGSTGGGSTGGGSTGGGSTGGPGHSTGGCGCDVAGTTSAPLAMLVLVALFQRRRLKLR
jgi:MYXO-CTERM domain-containing protein